MARETGEFETHIYWPDDNVAEVTVSPQTEDTEMRGLFQKEMRVTTFSLESERCLPLQALHTIASDGLYFKLRSSSQQPLHGNSLKLFQFHRSCLHEAKTAVVELEGGKYEIHLVAMSSGSSVWQTPCFWGYRVPRGLYGCCLQMFNMRNLSVVFDLDGILVVGNYLVDFERKLNTLKSLTLSTAETAEELKRCEEEMAILQQYSENDTVFANGQAIGAETEVVEPVFLGLPIVRPVIRLPETNTILTRIDPDNRCTSVLVKLRSEWDDLRIQVINDKFRRHDKKKGRERFEVCRKKKERFEAYICTKSPRDYALEMWRLLDPDGQIIDETEVNDTLVCVESGRNKSLATVFARKHCHPNMAIIIDDHMDVWDEKDRSHVHVVTPFRPNSAPELQMVAGGLDVARTVAFGAREEFFR